MKYSPNRHSRPEPLLEEPADPRVIAQLSAVVDAVPFHTVDWDALRASIVGDAAALLGRRVRKSWTTYVTTWANTMLPAGVAASVLAGLFVIYTSSIATQRTTGDEVALTPSGVLSTVAGMSSGTALAATVTQPLRAHEDTLLDEYVP